jgi:hypothetical protein
MYYALKREIIWSTNYAIFIMHIHEKRENVLTEGHGENIIVCITLASDDAVLHTPPIRITMQANSTEDYMYITIPTRILEPWRLTCNPGCWQPWI